MRHWRNVAKGGQLRHCWRTNRDRSRALNDRDRQDQTAAHHAGNRIEFRLGSAENLPIDDDFADFVFAFDLFDFSGDKERGLNEVRRILRPNGHLVVVKDFDIPDAKDSSLALMEILPPLGFTLLSGRFIKAEGVSFTMWVAALSG